MAATLYFELLIILSFCNPARVKFWTSGLPKDAWTYRESVLVESNPFSRSFEPFFIHHITIQRCDSRSHMKLSFAITLSTKRGGTCLALPSKPFIMDLTIYMDISRNPGRSPASSVGLKENCLRSDPSRFSCFVDSYIVYSKGHLYSLRKRAALQTLTPTIISTLKNLGLLRARRKRAGRLVRLKRARQSSVIPVIINSRPTHAWNFNYSRSRTLRRISALPSQPRIIPCCMVMNTRSVAKMDAFPALVAELLTNNCDLYFLTETWLKPIHPTHIVCPRGFCMIRKDRLDRGGGGVAIICRGDWKIERLDGPLSSEFECSWLRVSTPNSLYYSCVVYHPDESLYDQ